MLQLAGYRVAFVLGVRGTPRRDLEVIWRPLRSKDAATLAVSPGGAAVELTLPDGTGDPIWADASTSELDAAGLDGVVVVASAASVRRLVEDRASVALLRAIADRGRPVLAVSFGALVLARAGVLAGHAMTGAPEVRAEVEAAGASWHDGALVVSTGGRFPLVSAREAATPAELPGIFAGLVSALPRSEQPPAIIDEWGMESFPASDPAPTFSR
jgi:protease I